MESRRYFSKQDTMTLKGLVMLMMLWWHFILRINYWITFMSENIVRAELIKKINIKSYEGTHLIQVPVYLTAATSSEFSNAIFSTRAFEQNDTVNGGYNVFQVFVNNLLSIFRLFLDDGNINIKTYEGIKKILFTDFLSDIMINVVFLKKKNNFKTVSSMSIIFNEYWKNSYFYSCTFKKVFKLIVKKIVNI